MRRTGTLLIALLSLTLAGALLLSGCSGGGGSTNTTPGGGSGGGSTTAAPDKVTIKNFAFSPANVEVKAGTTVTWTNEDSSPHTVTADDSSFDSGNMEQGKTFSFTFSKAGTFAYHCSIHPSMVAQVVVK